MKVTIWTATTDGEGCDLTTTAHATEDDCRARLLRDLDASGRPLMGGEHTTGAIQEFWTEKMDGACIIEAHEVEVDASLYIAGSAP